MPLAVEVSNLNNGRWKASVPSMAGIETEGDTPEEAKQNARILAAEKLANEATIKKQGDDFFIYSPQLDVSSQGETPEEARQNLQETLVFYLSDDE